ncbi:MAG: hypothetical protein Q9M29_08675 [Mariprofundaceae bacterium]|nr:hypothetical protein [Mariprofundaceae bacterium]
MKTIHYLIIAACLVVAAPSYAATPIPDADSPQAKIYAEKCSVCHVLPHPKRLHFAQWQHMLTLMDRRMKERHVPLPGKEERQAIVDYLKTHAR